MQHALSAAFQVVLDALRHYEARVNALAFPGGMAEQLGVTWRAVETPDVVQDAQRLAGAALPAELEALWTELGAFTVPARVDWGVLTIFGSDDGTRGLLVAIADTWGGDRPEIARSFSSAERDRINAELLCFGVYTHDDNAHTHLCFDPLGRATGFLYDQDDWAAFEVLVRQRPQSSARIPALIAAMLDAAVSALTEEREDYGTSDAGAVIRIDRPERSPAASPSPALLALDKALAPLLLASDADAVFTTLRGWPTKDATWLQYAEGRIMAPTCTSEQRQVLKRMIKDAS